MKLLTSPDGLHSFTIPDAEIGRFSALYPTYRVSSAESFLPVDITELSIKERLLKDIDFGGEMVLQFLEDNRNDANVKTSDSVALLQKFAPIEALLRLGDIRKVRPLIASTPIDSIFTQERKDRYLAQIDTYLSQYAA